MLLTNPLFDTHPVVVHCGGYLYPVHEFNWKPIKEAFLASPPQSIGAVEDLTIITFNNGHDAMGVVEQSLDHLGVPYRVLGAGVSEWNNAVHKPRLTLEALEDIDTELVMAVDSRDGLVVGDPGLAVQRFRRDFDCEMLISADRFSYPLISEFKAYEDSLPGAADSEFRYLVAGAWLGRREFLREFFAAAAARDPLPEAPRSEQGILRALFQDYYPRVLLDYRCEIFQNVGFLKDPAIQIG